MPDTALCVDILLPLALDRQYTYALPPSMREHAAVGVPVMVPLGKTKRYMGIILRIHSDPPRGIALREVMGIVDPHPIVTPLQLQLWQWIADYYMATLGEVFKAAVPAALRLDSDTFLYPTPQPVDPPIELPELDARLYQLVLQRGGLALQQALRQMNRRGTMAAIHRLHAQGFIHFDERIRPARPRSREPFLQLAEAYCAIPWEQWIADPRWRLQRAPLQLAALEAYRQCCQELGIPVGSPVQRALLIKGKGVTPAAIGSLVAKGILLRVHPTESPSRPPQAQPLLHPLTPQQDESYQQLLAHSSAGAVSLLHGVTGSGKTEIYMHLIAHTLAQGLQTLYLLPEIALTTQMVGRVRAAFGDAVAVYHSRTPETERLTLYQALLRDQPLSSGHRVQVLLGARSCLFLPIPRLGLIIVDEEHEPSFKQDAPAPRYSGRDAAIMLARLSGARVILGSATPSVESYFNALCGRYQLVSLPGRYGPSRLPTVRLVDLARARKTKQIKGHFSHELLQAIQETVDRRGQVILFQNRRGYAPTLSCPQCAWTAMCPACDVSLTYHQFAHHLQCHYCGYTAQPVTVCPQCQAEQLSYRGLGTQRVVEELAEALPQLRIVRLDLDTTRSRHAYQRIFDDFANYRYDVLVGTQMVTKGLDFQGVQLVGIMDADAMLAIQDFRAVERAYQLMAQVGGRAGRREQMGEVIIQTRTPDLPIFQWVSAHDYQAFFSAIIAERKAVSYPPYWRLISIMATHPLHATAQAAMERVAELLLPMPRVRILGPQAPLIARVARMHRVQIYIKVPRALDYHPVRRTLRAAMATVHAHRPWASVRFTVDVDPI